MNHGKAYTAGMRSAVGELTLHGIFHERADAVEWAQEEFPTKPGGPSRSKNASLTGMEQARYQAELASRRYEAVDPANRLVAAELEARWNAALQNATEVAAQLEQFERESKPVVPPDKETLVSMAQDLRAVWNAPSTDRRFFRSVRDTLFDIMGGESTRQPGQFRFRDQWRALPIVCRSCGLRFVTNLP
jgi:hypothetical protein